LRLAASSLKSVDECGVVADIFESGHVFLGQVLLKSLKVLSPHLVSFFAQFKSKKCKQSFEYQHLLLLKNSSGGQRSNLQLNLVHFFHTSV